MVGFPPPPTGAFLPPECPQFPASIWSGKKWRAGVEHKSGNISETRKASGKVAMQGLQELTNALSNGRVGLRYVATGA